PSRFFKSDDLRHLADNGVLDMTSYFVSCSPHEAIDGRDVAACDAHAGVTKQRLDDQFAQAQFVRRAGVGMAEAVRRTGLTDDSSPRLREDGRVGPVTARDARKGVFSLTFDAAHDCLSSFW